MHSRTSRFVLAAVLLGAGYVTLLVALEVQRSGLGLSWLAAIVDRDEVRRDVPPATPVGSFVGGERDAFRRPDALSPSFESSALDANGPRGPGSDGGAAPTGEADATAESLVQFLTGGAAMSGAERERLVAIGKAIARYPEMRVSIDAYPDHPGADPLSATIATHRARVGQALLAVGGVQESRISTSTPPLEPGSRMAHSIRITTDPALAPSEQP